MKRFSILLITSILICMNSVAHTFVKDTLPTYQKCVINMPDDYSGRVVTTVVRKMTNTTSRKAILYIHGYNDFFYQTTLGDSIVSHGYNFYAVELRKYGRSILPSQTPFEVRNMNEYFADIDSALNVIKEDKNTDIILMAHSTGGLTASLYCQAHKDNIPFKAMILNSPFFDMNMSGLMKKIVVPFVSFLSKISRDIKLPYGDSPAYYYSLSNRAHGEWDKSLYYAYAPHPKTAGWVAAIHNGHKKVHKGMQINIPILLMYSDKSIYGDKWEPKFQTGDAVLNVKDIAKYGRMLGPNVTEFEVKNGLHDLILSSRNVRTEVYKEMFLWLNTIDI